jgi:hypothetical protein
MPEYESLLKQIEDIICKAQRPHNRRYAPEYLEEIATLTCDAADAWEREEAGCQP